MDFTPFQESILGWYAKHKRDLPWRKTQDPYKIMVSELMLQQTQVSRVIPKYVAFLEAYPTTAILARAKTSDVLRLWSGLGYNRRAISLQRAAQEIEKLGEFPSSVDDMERLPGIGPYTSRAVMSFAYGKDIAVMDTNIRRIFSRYYCGGAGTPREVDTLVTHAVPVGKGMIWNNALMDFGALVCIARSPQCTYCPLNTRCRAFTTGRARQYLRISAPQKKFEGSKRQSRGEILRQLASASNMRVTTLAKRLHKDEQETQEILTGMEREGLVKLQRGKAMLP